MCFIYGLSVGEHYFLVTFKFAVEQLKRTDDKIHFRHINVSF